MNKRAYTFAEILITLIIVAMVSLMSTTVIKSKYKSQKKKPDKGTYACTIYNGNEYIYEGTESDSPIPTNMAQWTQRNCGEGFKMPNTGLLEVTVIGGGGGGGSAGEKEFDVMSPLTTSHNYSFEVNATGLYDIEIYGNKGSESTLSYKNPLNLLEICRPERAYGGRAKYFSGSINLNKGDKISIQFSTGTASSGNVVESCGVTDYLFAKGYSGGNISINKNNIQIVRVNGGSGGSYWCSNSNGGCTQNKRFTSTSGSAGSVSYSSSFITPTQRDNYENFGTVKMKWSDANSFDSFKETTSGCGGDRGDSKSDLYPILRSTLPEISIGTGGTNGNAGQKTSFGTIVAKGGTGDFNCNTDASTPDTGGNGVDRVINADVTYYGGAAGTKTSRNGGKGSGFGSGGGGAGKSGSSYGTGGAGAPGLLILRW